METLEEKVGYLIAKIEEQGDDLHRVITKVDDLETTVREKLTTVETLFKVFKFLGVIVVAVATFQFGDIAKWWTILFK